ncbi:MAG: sodium/glutamate symporter [Desulfovibrio sp.]|nr:sodium/glutamate symporter [Desulfovibrio sp.]
MKSLWIGMCLVIVTVLTGGCTKETETSVIVRLGTGGTGGNYYSYGENLERLVRTKTAYGMETRTTSGSVANVRLLREGYVDMALVQSDTLRDALQGKGAFAAPLTGVHPVTGLYTESCQLVVSANSGITSVEELVGKRVSIGEDHAGVRQNALKILQTAGVPLDTLHIVRLSFSDAASAMSRGELDAFFVTAGAPTTSISALARKMPIRLVPLSETLINRICASDPAYTATEIAEHSYEGQPSAVHTVGVTAVLVAADTLSKDAEKAIVDIVTEHGSKLKKISFGVPATPKKDEGMLIIPVNMYLTLALAVCVLYLGVFVRRRVTFLETFCIPAPVIGGLIFAVISCVFHALNLAEFHFDETLRNVCMIMFFTSVGFQANFKVLKSGGLPLLLFLACVVGLILLQNALAVGLAHVVGVTPFIGLCTGSIPMVGGHGTAGAFGSVLQDLGLESAVTLCTAAATFGLVAGSLMGGPLARRLIIKHDLLTTARDMDASVLVEDQMRHRRKVSMYAPAAYQLAIAMGLGTLVSYVLSKTGMTFPAYIGAMIVAAIIRNFGEFTGKFEVHMGEINDLGGISLSLFLGIAMITLKLWQLASLALPLFILLTAQAVLMAAFAYFVVFNIMGKDYDAAVLCAGCCGFGMGATPNAMANMQALTEKFLPSIKAYILVPIVGSMFADFFNSLIITFFINFV